MYPYYPVYMQAPQKPPLNEEPPVERAPSGPWTDRFGMWFAVGTGLVTLLALVLAVLAPSLGLRTANAVPDGWTKVLDGAVAPDAWSLSTGCFISAQGLDVVASGRNAICLYGRSAAGDLTSRGFLLEVRVAPAGSVEGNQQPLIEVGSNFSGVSAAFTQSGQYQLCTGATSDSCTGGNTIAWHSDSYIANSIGLRYLPEGNSGRVTLFANGQEVTSAFVTVAPGAQISLGATANTSSSAEAVYTHVTLYTATP